MQVPVVSSVDSWKRKKTKFLLKLKDNVTQFLSFFTLWNKSLQKIGGALLTFYFKQKCVLHMLFDSMLAF